MDVNRHPQTDTHKSWGYNEIKMQHYVAVYEPEH